MPKYYVISRCTYHIARWTTCSASQSHCLQQSDSVRFVTAFAEAFKTFSCCGQCGEEFCYLCGAAYPRVAGAKAKLSCVCVLWEEQRIINPNQQLKGPAAAGNAAHNRQVGVAYPLSSCTCPILQVVFWEIFLLLVRMLTHDLKLPPLLNTGSIEHQSLFPMISPDSVAQTCTASTLEHQSRILQTMSDAHMLAV